MMSNKRERAKDAVIMREQGRGGNNKWRRVLTSKGMKTVLLSGASCVVVAAAVLAGVKFIPASAGAREEVALKTTLAPEVTPTLPVVYETNHSYAVDPSETEQPKVEIPDNEPATTELPIANIPFSGTLEQGTTDESIKDIQNRFMELLYMDPDEPTDYYGPLTQDAVKTFQLVAGLEVTGEMDAVTYVALMSETAPEYVLMEGMQSEDVLELQLRLWELGYLTAKPTGYFGTLTTDGVRAFQAANGLSKTGKINSEMRELLYSPDAVANLMTMGDSGDEIKQYQERLYELAYLLSEPDGKFGEDTIVAVKRFQERNGLISDGRLGPQTIQALMAETALPNALSIGVRGDDVLSVQERLNELEYLTDDMLTGYFGGVTDYAVRAFQRENGLKADGRVGKVTMAKLFSSEAKEAPAGYNQQDNSNAGGGNSNPGGGGSNSGGGTEVPPAADQPSIRNMIDIALSRLGCRYVRGGKGPNKFDCSGFVYWTLNQAGIKQGYLTSYGWRSVKHYPRINDIDDLQAGDVIVLYGHVGLIISDTEMVDASSGRGCVVRRTFKSSWCRRDFICGYRVFG